MKEIYIDGIFHFQVNDSFIYIPNNKLTHHQLLVGRGYNGVVASEDFTSINTFPYCHVKTWGIDRYDVPPYPIDTFVDLYHSQVWLVIIITLQKSAKATILVNFKHPAITLLMSNFIMPSLVILSDIVPISFSLKIPITIFLMLILLSIILVVIVMEIMTWLSPTFLSSKMYLLNILKR